MVVVSGTFVSCKKRILGNFDCEVVGKDVREEVKNLLGIDFSKPLPELNYGSISSKDTVLSFEDEVVCKTEKRPRGTVFKCKKKSLDVPFDSKKGEQ